MKIEAFLFSLHLFFTVSVLKTSLFYCFFLFMFSINAVSAFEA